MARPAPVRFFRVVGGSILAVVVAALVAACTPAGQPSPTPTSTPSATATTSTPAPTSSTTPAAPTFQPDGSAEDNLAIFRAVTETVWSSSEQASGRAYIDALVAAGFDRSAMQVTNDTTTVGDPAESIQFAVLWSDGECLIGQVGPATGSPVTAVLPAVGDRMCLLGSTRPIDW